MKYIIAILFALFTSFAFAEITTADISDFNKLNAIQKADIVKQIALKTESTKTPSQLVTKRDLTEMTEWVEMGKGLGSVFILLFRNICYEINTVAKPYQYLWHKEKMLKTVTTRTYRSSGDNDVIAIIICVVYLGVIFLSIGNI